MFFEWMSDPTAWIGLATLVVLEIVLGIDNLVFIAVLAEKLPPEQRDKARILGLSLALGMRFILLASIAWIVSLQAVLFTIFGHGFSGRDLILIFGGIFLLFKGTMELHERLEGHQASSNQRTVQAAFWQVILQIVVLDAVFSLDSVITAVGMVKHLSIMYLAVIIAMSVMVLMAKPLMSFVSRHPTVVILCLGFLMMIGFSLITEGFGFHVPKGYLYAAIGFSVGIEALNQLARRNREKYMMSGDLRDRTANAVLRLLGGTKGEGLDGTADVIATHSAAQSLFAPAEKEMIQGVLSLSERRATSVMTPRSLIDWIDLDSDQSKIRDQILEQGHSRFLIGRGGLDNYLGVALTRDLMRDLLTEGQINTERSVRDALLVHESMSVLKLVEMLRKSPVQMAVVIDEFGSIEGIVTPTDVLEIIAGEFTDADEEPSTEHQQEDGSWLFDGDADLQRISYLLGHDMTASPQDYSTLAGYVIHHIGRIPAVGDIEEIEGLTFEIIALRGNAIDKIRVFPAVPRA